MVLSRTSPSFQLSVQVRALKSDSRLRRARNCCEFDGHLTLFAAGAPNGVSHRSRRFVDLCLVSVSPIRPGNAALSSNRAAPKE